MKKRIVVLILLISIISVNISSIFKFPTIFSKSTYNGKPMSSATILPEYLWNRTWGGSGSEGCLDMALDSQGNVYLVGFTGSYGAGGYDIALVKFDDMGNFRWYQTWGTSLSEMGFSIAIDSFDNIYIAGCEGPPNYERDFLIKYDKDGDELWNKTWVGGRYLLGCPDMALDSSDNIYFFGESVNGSYYLGKFDSLGNVFWNKTWSDGESLRTKAIDIDSNDNIYIVGRYDGYSSQAFRLFRFNTSGNLIWDQWRTLTDWYDAIYDVKCDSDGNIFIGGHTGDGDFMLVKYNNSGSKLWEKTYGNIGYQKCLNLCVDNYDNIYMIGQTDEYGTDDLLIIKCDKSGTLLWSYIWESPNNLVWNMGITLDNLNNIFVGGRLLADMYVLKLHQWLFKVNKPLSNEIYGFEAPSYELVFHSENLNTTSYTLNNSQKYFFLNESGKINQTEWDLLGNGTVSVKFFANDTLGYIDSKEIIVRKDLIEPNIIIHSPAPYQLYGNFSPNFHVSIEEPNLNSSWYTLDGGLTNYTFSSSFISLNQSAWEMCNNGSVEIIFYAIDAANNLGYTTIEVYKDINAPYIEIIFPEPFKLYGKRLNYNVIKHGIDINSTWYTINDGPIFMFNDNSGEINQNAWNNTDEGLVTLKFYINDSFSREMVSEVRVYKDAIEPTIIINSPLLYELIGISAPNYDVNISDIHLDSMWYTLDNGLTNFTFFSPLGITNQSAWTSQEDGNITIRFYASDLANNIAFKDRVVIKDATPPDISIISPESHESFLNSTPSYNISINEPHLDRKWYTINNGIECNITDTYGVINQSMWDACEDGYVNITFYANDFLGNLGHKSVIVIKNLKPRNAYAIVIGISNYPGTDDDLSYCDDDAVEVYNMLIDDYNFRSENIIYLQDSSATQSAINNAFNSISSLINQDDIFFFYYSGHGGADLVNIGTRTHYIQSPHPYPDNFDYSWWYSYTDAAYMRVHFEILDLENGYDYIYIGDSEITDGYYYQSLTGYNTNFWSDWIPILNDNRIYVNMVSDSFNPSYYWGFRIDMVEVIRFDDPHYLCPYDSLPSNPSNYYTDTLLDSKLDSLNCDHKYVVLDACNSGGMITEAQETDNFIMTACKGGQFSMEEPALNNGIFTYYFLESVYSANDQNGDGAISMEECFSYVSSHTQSYSASYGPGIQYHPQKYDGIDGESVLYPSLSPVSYNFIENNLYYSFNLYGHGLLKTLNITVCTILPDITFKTFILEDIVCTSTGFGFYNDSISIEAGYNITGFEIVIEIEGSKLITIREVYGDSDNDGLTDFFEILQGNGVDPLSNDTDSDGLNDYEEFYGPTDPLISDTDFDGLLDGEEVNQYGTDPLDSDSDSDGLIDGEEVNIYNTDPSDEDTDSDTIPDGWEVNNLLDPITNDTALDPDNDSLTNLQEYQHNTQPFNNDTDSDGLLDGDEINIYSTNPNEGDTDSDGLTDREEVKIYNTDPLNNDSDYDGLLDGQEVDNYNTNPLSGDTDADLMPDKWEIDNFLNPLVNDTALDPDTDGLTNIEEYQIGTDPQLEDTDGDTWSDGDEVVYDTDPLDPDDYPTIPTIPDAISGFILVPLISLLLICSIILGKQVKSKIKKF